MQREKRMKKTVYQRTMTQFRMAYHTCNWNIKNRRQNGALKIFEVIMAKKLTKLKTPNYRSRNLRKHQAG